MPPRHDIRLSLTASTQLGGIARIRIQHRIVLRLHLLWLLLLVREHLRVHGLPTRVLHQEVLAARQVADVRVSLRIQVLLIHPVLIVHLTSGAEVLQVWPLGRVTARKQSVIVHGCITIGPEASGPRLLAVRRGLPSLPRPLVVHVTLGHVQVARFVASLIFLHYLILRSACCLISVRQWVRLDPVVARRDPGADNATLRTTLQSRLRLRANNRLVRTRHVSNAHVELFAL